MISQDFVNELNERLVEMGYVELWETDTRGMNSRYSFKACSLFYR